MILAADIGGTKIAAALVGEDGTLRSDTRRVTTPAESGAQTVLEATVTMLEQLDHHQVDLLAIASAGVIDTARGVVVSSTDSIAGWANTPIGAYLSRRFRRDVRVIGDGHAFGVGEALYGAGRGLDSLLLIAVGTGVGGSFNYRGSPLLGAHHSAGHVGHIAVPEAADLLCPCGRIGHLEAVASGTGILAAYYRAGGNPTVLSTQELLTRSHDPAAEHAICVAGSALGRGAASLANVLDPDVIVISGGLVGAGPRWERPLRVAFAAGLLPALARLSLVVSTQGSAMALRGAATRAAREGRV